MKIVFTTEYGSNYKDIADLTTNVMREYCEKHGYEFRPLLLDGTGNEYAYKKHEYFKELFKEKIDTIFYLDADAIVTNFGVKIESFLDSGSSFYITRHIGELNGGAMIIRNTVSGRLLNQAILNRRNEYDNEQNVINALYADGAYRLLISVVPHPAFNSFDYSLYPECHNIRAREQGHWHEGDFVLHVPGLGIEHRLEVLKQYAQKIKR